MKHNNFLTLFMISHLMYLASQARNVANYQSPETLTKALNLSLPKEGVSLYKIIDFIETYKKYSVDTSDKQFFNQLFSAPSPMGVLGEIITTLTQTSMYTFEMAPVATLIEQALIKKLTSIVGYENGEGIFVTGGSNANLMALFAARNNIMPYVQQKGLDCGHKLVCFVSDQAHYSFRKAANIIGIGSKNVIAIESDQTGRMNTHALEQAIQKALHRGAIPFFVCATAGTTVRGAFDPLEAIAPIAQKYNLWLHVDAAFGGSVMLSEKHRSLVAGINHADSVTWDFHKVMGIPLICSVILMKKKGTLYALNNLDDDGYLFHDDNEYNLGHLSLQCGRRVDALKLWIDWMHKGDNGYEEHVNKLFACAQYAAKKVRESKHLRLIEPQHYLTICFQYVPDGASFSNDTKTCNDATKTLRKELIKKGKSMVNYGCIGQRTCIRLVITNPAVTTKDIDIFFDNIKECTLMLT